MPTPQELITDINEIIKEIGTPTTFTTYGTQTFATGGYDDEQLPVSSGTTFSGGAIIIPIGQADKQYVEQGLVNWNDTKIIVTGSLLLKTNMLITLGNTGSYYEVLPRGIMSWTISGTNVYHEVFLRQTFSGQHAGLI